MGKNNRKNIYLIDKIIQRFRVGGLVYDVRKYCLSRLFNYLGCIIPKLNYITSRFFVFSSLQNFGELYNVLVTLVGEFSTFYNS